MAGLTDTNTNHGDMNLTRLPTKPCLDLLVDDNERSEATKSLLRRSTFRESFKLLSQSVRA